MWEKRDGASINYLFIHKDYRGRGIGSRLLKEMIKQTDDMGVVELHVGTEKENERAISLY